MRRLARRRFQLRRDRVRIQNQVESLWEETRIKRSSVTNDLFGSSGMRILAALSQGECDPQQLASMAAARLQGGEQALREALVVRFGPIHRERLRQHLEMLRWMETQMERTAGRMADSTRPHLGVSARLTALVGNPLTPAAMRYDFQRSGTDTYETPH